MYNKIILFSSLLIASNFVLAEGLVEGAAKQMVKDKATSAASDVVGETPAGAALGKASALKDAADTVPSVATDPVGAVKAKVKEEAADKALKMVH
jgi:hypothetical protein